MTMELVDKHNGPKPAEALRHSACMRRAAPRMENGRDQAAAGVKKVLWSSRTALKEYTGSHRNSNVLLDPN